LVHGVEDLALWTKSKKKKGPMSGAPPQGGESSSGTKRNISTVRCFACGDMGHYAGQCPKKKKTKQSDMFAATAKETEFT
jgi:hypothetical protein